MSVKSPHCFSAYDPPRLQRICQDNTPGVLVLACGTEIEFDRLDAEDGATVIAVSGDRKTTVFKAQLAAIIEENS